LLLVAALGLAAGLWTATRNWGVVPAADSPSRSAATVLPAPKVIGAFHLVDQEGRAFGAERFRGRWSFLFFGYTHCPDVCPMTMATLRQVRDRLAAEPDLRDGTQFVFVSVDPERDTPDQLRGYVAHYGADFIGVTGNDAELQRLTRPLGALYARPAQGPGAQYAVDHTASIFLFEPGGGLHAIFSGPHQAEAIARAFREIRRGAS
jgi:protein SCO1/2